MEQEIGKKVFRVISDNLDIGLGEISLDSKIEDLSQDSIRLFQLIIAFEKEFEQQVKYEDLMQIITVRDIISYIEKNIK